MGLSPLIIFFTIGIGQEHHRSGFLLVISWFGNFPWLKYSTASPFLNFAPIAGDEFRSTRWERSRQRGFEDDGSSQGPISFSLIGWSEVRFFTQFSSWHVNIYAFTIFCYFFSYWPFKTFSISLMKNSFKGPSLALMGNSFETRWRRTFFRYAYSHGITPRHSDIVPIEADSGKPRLTLKPRSLRVSLTFRKTLAGPCKWDFLWITATRVLNSQIDRAYLSQG